MGLHIMVVDDHAGSLYALAKLLTLTGHEVRVAGTAAAALRAADDGWGVDLLIADLGLPGGAALGLVGQVRGLGGLGNGAGGGSAIALTADDDPRAEPAWRDAGYGLLLRKPLRFADIEAAIRAVAGGDLSPGTATVLAAATAGH